MYINLPLLLFKFVYLFFLSFPLNIFISLIVIALFPSWHLALVLFSSLCFRLVLFLTGGYYFWFPLFTCQSIVLYFLGTIWFCLWVYIYVCISHYFSYQLPDFVTDICLWRVFCFSFLCYLF